MAVWSIVNFSKLTDIRLDPEYYQQKYLELEYLLNLHNPICVDNFAFITDGIHNPPERVEENGVVYLTAKCVKENYFSLTDVTSISLNQHLLNQRTEVKAGDVLLTTTGTIGDSAVVQDEIIPANTDRDVGIIRIHNQHQIDPYFLATFLNSKFGKFQTLREATGNVQQHLFISKIKKILVPIDDCFNEIGNLTRKAYDKRREAEALYAEAEGLLLHDLGLDKLDLSTQKTYVANFSETVESDRLDAEYYNPKYTVLINYLHKIPHSKLGYLASFSNGATPYGAKYLDEGIPFLRIQNVNKNRLNLDDVVYIDEKIHGGILKRSQVQPGDVLITITGRIGTTAVIPDSLTVANMNQHSVRLRIHNNQINPYYLSVFLNSKAGLLQTDREAYGATRDALPYYCLEKIIIPIVSLDLQNEVESKVREAEKTLKEAKNLLGLAKYKVEQIILGN